MRKTLITLSGGLLVLVGVPMLLLPGPGLLVIILGLSLLGVEYAWARRHMRSVTRYADERIARLRERRARRL